MTSFVLNTIFTACATTRVNHAMIGAPPRQKNVQVGTSLRALNSARRYQKVTPATSSGGGGPRPMFAPLLRKDFRLPYSPMVKDGLLPGLTRTQTYVTTLEMRARQLAADIFSTPAMIGLMERTSVELTEPHLDENEQTVGIHVDVRHMAATKIGQRVTITSEILEVKKDKIRYSVSATNDQGVKIGDGRHRRAVINTKKFGAGS